ncbi:MAG: hypothetical protein BV459_00380 [Thermoplasmata archaeon M11B2D]|nr:MAG: hypothetical protein BV459_00380 [Thermoplasmata archaeon M11B2D]
MTTPSVYRENFKQYCLRKLGAPVIEINVEDVQVEDRIDDALLLYAEHHFEGTEKVFMKHVVTQQDINRGYIVLPETVQSVVRLLPFNTTGYYSDPLFNARYQFMLDEVFEITNVGTALQDWYIANQHIDLFNYFFDRTPVISFNKHMNRLKIEMNWEEFCADKSVVIMEAYQLVDVEQHPDVWSDRWLKEYATALIKKQWGINMKKFNNVSLPGGITMNGKEIYDEAIEEIRLLEEELLTGHSAPIEFFKG